MTDIAVTEKQFQTDSRPWLLFEAVGHQQPTATESGPIDFREFDAETHYPQGWIASGIALAWNTAGDRLIPASATDAGDVAGLLYNATTVPERALSRKVVVAFVSVFAVVDRRRLPPEHGVTDDVEAALPHIVFRETPTLRG